MRSKAQPEIQSLILLFGELDQQRASEILALDPTDVELEQAALWLNGGGDILVRSGQPQTLKIKTILEILDTRDDEDDRA